MSITISMVANAVLAVGNAIVAIACLASAFSGADAPSDPLLWAVTAAVCFGLSKDALDRIEERLGE